MTVHREPDLRRSVLFVAGADADAQALALQARPDVLVQDLEDFTPPDLKRAARERAATLFERARAAGIVPAVRVNPLGYGGEEDLRAVLGGRPALVLLPMARTGSEVAALAAELERLEPRCGLEAGVTEIVPNAETAAGVVNLRELAGASPRVRSCLLGAEDLVADLRAERAPDGLELAYARARFLLECRAFGVEPIDAPYTYGDAAGCERETLVARRLGYGCKSLVLAEHVAVVQRVLTPGSEAVARAQRLVEAFEAARAQGRERALLDGHWIEPPAYRNARRVLTRAERLASADR